MKFFILSLCCLAAASAKDVRSDLKNDDSGKYVPDDLGKYVPDDSGKYIHDDSGNYVNDDSGKYVPDNLGRYVPDESGKYVNDDSGKYVPDNLGRYVPDDSGKYVHDNSGDYKSRQKRQSQTCAPNGTPCNYLGVGGWTNCCTGFCYQEVQESMGRCADRSN